MIEPIKGTEYTDPRSPSEELESIRTQFWQVVLESVSQASESAGENNKDIIREIMGAYDEATHRREREARIDEAVRAGELFKDTPFDSDFIHGMNERLNELKKGEE